MQAARAALLIAAIAGCGGIAVIDPEGGTAAAAGSGGSGATGGIATGGSAGAGAIGGSGGTGASAGAGGSGAAGGSGGSGAAAGSGGAGASGGGGGSGGAAMCSGDDECLSGPCFDGICVDGVCVQVPVLDGTPCDDGKGCTLADSCVQGTCGGAPLLCPGFPPCNVGKCAEPFGSCELQALPDGTPCEDGDLCTDASECDAGICEPTAVVSCPSAGPCQVGACDAVVGCTVQNLPDGTPCDDGNPCTVGESCSAGACGGAMGPQVFFTDDFSTSNEGWVLGTEWEIGPATASAGQQFGNADPNLDHTPGLDNGVAGVDIGGNADTFIHPFRYLESPPIDTTGAAAVYLRFWRWLNSDWTPWMESTIEVWDGAAWTVLWTSGGVGVTDSVWSEQVHDISGYSGPDLRVRFGVKVGSNGAFAVGSWNIDDVVVSEGPCP